ncbi:hypothetical protein DM01DRAFT_1332954 [Hesseltinella vesiculosa]|uniref:Zn(2)-C6 fungal-type domain-containing protein n=1 Tax=Hesseltinella vesiculosa TaxID=101127 RepID=A0A1X2GQT6_9FUNG|nr:hypothetical protein DM01DRAFT_1332954 [Hesseltinella vesiculosa]
MQQHPPPHTAEPSRKRSKKERACDLCRRKKIRCDFNHIYPDNMCSSCRGYGKMCTFNEAAKKRGPPKGYVEALENRLKRMEHLLLTMASSSQISPATVRHYINDSRDDNDDQGDAFNDEDETADGQDRSASPSISPPPAADQPPAKRDALESVQIENAKKGLYSYLGSSSGVYMLDQLYPKAPGAKQMVRGTEDDVMVARVDIATNFPTASEWPKEWPVPPKPVLDRLVDLYFEKLNRFLPIIDEQEFMEKYEKGQVTEPLLISIARTTLQMISDDDPVFPASQVTRRALYEKCSSIMNNDYDIDFMVPDISTIQILLLGALTSGDWGPKSTNWLAVSIAVKMAQDLGLHRSNNQWNASGERGEARKRLWWSAYVIDRWVCAGLGRPLSVNDADCDLEYPSVGENGEYTAFVAVVKLSCILGDVLRAICSPRARSMSDQSKEIEQIAKQLTQALDHWHEALPPTLRLDRGECQRIHDQDIDEALKIKLTGSAGYLRLTFNAVKLLTRRPFIYFGETTTSTVVVPDDCMNLLREMFDLYTKMPPASLFQMGWSLSSYSLSQMTMLFLLNLRNVDPAIVEEASKSVDVFKQTVKQLENNFIECKFTAFVDYVKKTIEEEKLPSETPTKAPTNTFWGASSGMDWHQMVDFF